MTSYFDEKAAQVSPGSLVAFGITINSRYAKAGELIEMLAFAQKAALAGVEDAVEKVFYDSKAGICSFVFHGGKPLDDLVEQKLFAAAKESINQFEWLDGAHHRGEEDDR